MTEAIERETGSLFGRLWSRYDDELFKSSVELFALRWSDNGEPADHLVGKRCLDAGCGGGRYSFAMGLMGASEVVGVDIGEDGLEDARRRSADIETSNVSFQRGSVLDLPFGDEHFDFVLCSGILHHTPSVERGLHELHRVLRPGGSLYLLLYGSGGLYWPLNLVARPFAAYLGAEEVERCVAAAELPANKRRTVLDDLFVPILETYTVERVDTLLQEAGFSSWRRWSRGQRDHEATPEAMVEELRIRVALWRAGADTATDDGAAAVERHLERLSGVVVAAAEDTLAAAAEGSLGEARLRELVIGTGHHRIVAEKPTG